MITRTFLALFGVSLIVGFIIIYIIFYFSGIPSTSTLLTTNYVMMIIHFLVAIVMFTASSCKTDGWEMFYEREVIPEGGLEGNNVQEKLQNLRKRLFEKETQKVTITSIFKLCALFSFITALAHGFLYFNKSFYSSLINSSQNPFRWLEYFFSSGIMMACIASVSDIKTEYALLSVFVFTAITNIFGMAIEATSSNRYKLSLGDDIYYDALESTFYSGVVLGQFLADKKVDEQLFDVVSSSRFWKSLPKKVAPE